VVEMVSTTVLRLATVGRDDVLRVSTGDWVEILDDHYELGQKPGELRKVTVDDAARTITFTGAIPTDLRPVDAADAAARHLRVRRWDQAGGVHAGAGTPLTGLAGSQTDCRRLWPPLGDGGDHGCECTICLTPDSPIGLQDAVDQIKAVGGTICLAAGVYDLGAGVTITGARSLRIRGQGPATILVA